MARHRLHLDGVQDPTYVASSVISEYRRRQRYRNGGIVDSIAQSHLVVLPAREVTKRNRLLAAARRGDKNAAVRLQALYGLTLIVGDNGNGRKR